MGQEVATLQVYRFDPQGSEISHYDQFKVPYSKGLTVLDALIYIYENVDASLSFRWSCKNVQCGTCGMVVNGEAVLACERQLREGEVVRVDPFPLPVIKDVVTDFSSVEDKKVRVFSRLKPAGRPDGLSPEEVSPLISLHKCLDCHICDVVCPLNKGRERIGPEDFLPADLVQLASLAFNKREGEERIGSAYSKRVYDCLTCGVCVKACPMDINIVEDAVEKLRQELMKGGGGPYRKLFDPKDWVERWVELRGVPYLSESKEEYGVANAKGRVAFFVGCVMNRREQEMADRAIRILNRARYEVIVPKGQSCCGQPLMRLGMMDEAKELLKKNISVFEETRVIQVVTACPDCSFAFREDFGRLVGSGDRRPRFEVLDFISLLPTDLSRKSEKIVCHNPCYLLKQGIRLSDELSKRGVEIDEVLEECCGAGGGVFFTNPELAREVSQKAINKIGSDTLITGCPFCKAEFEKVIGKEKKLIHYIEYVEAFEK